MSQKKRINFQVRDLDEEESNGSYSEPSDGNLEDDQLMQLIPKKLGKFKFLRGVEEEKKKPVPPQEKKEDKKKPKPA
jgi:hypothetical protein